MVFQLPEQKKIIMDTTLQNEEASVELLTVHERPWFIWIYIYNVHFTVIGDCCTESFSCLIIDSKSTTCEFGPLTTNKRPPITTE
jgi:hypothetical protein